MNYDILTYFNDEFRITAPIISNPEIIIFIIYKNHFDHSTKYYHDHQ